MRAEAVADGTGMAMLFDSAENGVLAGKTLLFEVADFLEEMVLEFSADLRRVRIAAVGIGHHVIKVFL